MPRRPFDLPEWDGTPLAGRRMLAGGEQGVGEEIMFASVLLEVGGEVTVECDPRLVPLFARSLALPAVGRRTPPDPRTAGFDVQCALGSLCWWLRPHAEAFGPRAYLVADAGWTAALRRRYAALGPGLKVGIAWHSKGARRRFSAAKSSPLAAWRPLLARPAVFVNLQYGDVAAELAAVKRDLGVEVRVDPEVDQITSLDDFAAQIAALDLVITTANTTAHLAGALGVETWMLLPARPDWRWQRGRCIWYPRARLFRQERPDGWDGLLTRVAAALRARGS